MPGVSATRVYAVLNNPFAPERWMVGMEIDVILNFQFSIFNLQFSIFNLVRYWVIAAAAPWMATEYAADGQVEAADGAVLLQGLDGILAASGGETAGGGRQG